MKDSFIILEISVESATVYTTDELLNELRLEKVIHSPQGVDDAAITIRDYYTSSGYLNTRVRTEPYPNMELSRLIVFRVRESEKFYVESNVEGY